MVLNFSVWAAGNRIPTWEESKPVKNNNTISTWEDYKRERIDLYRMTEADRKRINNAFKGNPLEFIDSEWERMYLFRATDYLPDRDEYRKKMALAAYFTVMNRKSNFSSNMANMDHVLRQHFRKRISVTEAYDFFASIYNASSSPWHRMMLERVNNITSYAIIFSCFLCLFFALWLGYCFVKVFFYFVKKCFVIKKAFSFLSNFQKIAFFMSLTSVLLLSVPVWGYDELEYGFYIFLRWVVCLALAGKLKEKFPPWFKFILVLAAILYNPVAPIRLGESGEWFFVNCITVPLIVASEIIVMRRAYLNGIEKKMQMDYNF